MSSRSPGRGVSAGRKVILNAVDQVLNELGTENRGRRFTCMVLPV